MSRAGQAPRGMSPAGATRTVELALMNVHGSAFPARGRQGVVMRGRTVIDDERQPASRSAPREQSRRAVSAQPVHQTAARGSSSHVPTRRHHPGLRLLYRPVIRVFGHDRPIAGRCLHHARSAVRNVDGQRRRRALTAALDPSSDWQITSLVSPSGKNWISGNVPDTMITTNGAAYAFGSRAAGFTYTLASTAQRRPPSGARRRVHAAESEPAGHPPHRGGVRIADLRSVDQLQDRWTLPSRSRTSARCRRSSRQARFTG